MIQSKGFCSVQLVGKVVGPVGSRVQNLYFDIEVVLDPKLDKKQRKNIFTVWSSRRNMTGVDINLGDMIIVQGSLVISEAKDGSVYLHLYNSEVLAVGSDENQKTIKISDDPEIEQEEIPAEKGGEENPADKNTSENSKLPPLKASRPGRGNLGKQLKPLK